MKNCMFLLNVKTYDHGLCQHNVLHSGLIYISFCVFILSKLESWKKTSALDIFIGEQMRYSSHLFTITHICRRSLGLVSSKEDSMETSWEGMKTYN